VPIGRHFFPHEDAIAQLLAALPLGRPHRESGEKIVVPNHKIKWDDGNPTGHGIIFIGMGGQVYCYVPPGGV
jgi:hypothetical protein